MNVKISNKRNIKKSFHPLYDHEHLNNIKKELKNTYSTMSRDTSDADRLFQRLTTPLNILDQLYELSPGVLTGNKHDIDNFRLKIYDLIHHFQNFNAMVENMKKQFVSHNDIKTTNTPHGILNMSGQIPIYLSIFSIFGTEFDDLKKGLNTISLLNIAHENLEILNGSLNKDGDHLKNTITWKEALNDPFFDLTKKPKMFDLENIFEYLDKRHKFEPVRTLLNKNNMLHFFCSIMTENYFNGPEYFPTPPENIRWADNITSINMLGECAGSRIIINGYDFGDEKPRGVDLIMTVNDVCVPVVVDPSKWSDSSIEVILPQGINSGPVGFANTGYLNRLRDKYSRSIRKASIASRCFLPYPNPIKPNLSKCPPSTNTNMITAGLPIIRDFKANSQDIAIVEPNDTIVLSWNVENSDEINIEKTSNEGLTFGNSNSLINPIGTSYNLGSPNHNEPKEYNYRLTAINSCGIVTKNIIIICSKKPNITIQNIEVTQGIQRTDNSVKLIKNKQTVIRVFMNHGLNGFWNNEVSGVTGRIKVYRSNNARTGWFYPINGSGSPPMSTQNASITVPNVVVRKETDHTLNFLIPAYLCEDTIRIIIEVKIVGFGRPNGGLPGFDETIEIPGSINTSFYFHERAPLTIRYIRVNNGRIPSHDVCIEVIRRSLQRIPTPDYSTITLLQGSNIECIGNDEDDIKDILSDFDDRHNCSTLESFWPFCECPEDDHAIWALITGETPPFGKAADIPSNTYITSGMIRHVETAAHELSHCKGQSHIEVCGAPHGDDASSWPNGGKLIDVPFDIEENSTVCDFKKGVWDIMTYCDTRWPMPKRWNALYSNIGA